MASVGRKICMLGDFGVGKTSLVRRYVVGSFSPDYHATIGVNVYKYSDDLPIRGGTVRLDQIIWDIEGHEQPSALLGTYVHGAAGAVIVGDVTRGDVIESLARHTRMFQGIRPGRPVVFALNKKDLLAAGAPLPPTDGLEREFGMAAIVTSALSGEGVPALFRTLGTAILRIGA